MEKIKKILAPTDFSELSFVGLRRALELARAQNSEVIVLYVIGIGEDWFPGHQELNPVRVVLDTQKKRLEKIMAEKFADFAGIVEVRQLVELGNPYKNIVELAERENVDLIVLSTHGRTGIDHMLIGSVTDKVVARAPCAVLAIPPARRKAAESQAA